VIFTSGILSAFLVNDVVCLVMPPFIVKLTRRWALEPTPYLLAVATASNVGSVSTITGNPQNMLIGSLSRIPYRSFLAHLAPVAIAGLFVDWGLLHFLYRRPRAKLAQNEPSAAARSDRHPPRLKPVVVLAIVLVGFALEFRRRSWRLSAPPCY
jgi:Na+/H+ antiporter NhaD/arsenite permease-like protein